MKTFILATVVAVMLHASWVNSQSLRTSVARMATLNIVLGR